MALPQKVVLLGSGGHAKVIFDILKADPLYEIVGCTSQRTGLVTSSLPVLGDDAILPELYAAGVRHAFVAVGDNQKRQEAALKAQAIGFELVNARSSFSYVADSVTLGQGIAIMAGAVIHPDTVVGYNAIINTGASVDHDCAIGASSHVAPGCHVAGRVAIGDGTFLGAGSTVIDGIVIGSFAVVGAGAVVTSDLPDKCLAVGVPARIIKFYGNEK